MAVVLDSESRKTLLAWWAQTTRRAHHVDVKAHHMTIWYDPPKDLEFPIGLRVSMKVIGWAADERGQAVKVLSKEVLSHNLNPHVTIAVAEGVGAVYSNELLARGWERADGPHLTGVLQILL